MVPPKMQCILYSAQRVLRASQTCRWVSSAVQWKYKGNISICIGAPANSLEGGNQSAITVQQAVANFDDP
jgi:hypothetical protein